MQQRNLGLDMVRSLSILMVIVSHSQHFFTPHAQNPAFFQNFSIVGLYAVEMFFALSGFLIGQILLEEVIPVPDRAHIIRFYLRRWLRTLPAYYLVLSALVLIQHLFGADAGWHWRHFLFLQNFSASEVSYFGVSWTLSVEEWFYFLTPLLVLAFLGKPEYARTRMPWLLLLAIVFFPLARYVYVLQYNPSWDFGVRKFFPLRFDALFIGISIAWIRAYAPRLYRSLATFSCFAACLAGLFLVGAFFAAGFPDRKILDASIFAKVWSFSLISIFLSASLPFVEQSRFINRTMADFAPARIFFTRTSHYAYMIYLLHLEVFILLYPRSTSLLSGLLWLIVGLVISVPCAIFLHHYFEKPIMDLRSRLPHPYN